MKSLQVMKTNAEIAKRRREILGQSIEN